MAGATVSLLPTGTKQAEVSGTAFNANRSVSNLSHGAKPKLAQHGDGVLRLSDLDGTIPQAARFPSRALVDGNEARDRALAPRIQTILNRSAGGLFSPEGACLRGASMEIAGFALLFLTVAGVVVWSMLNAREPARGD